MNAEMAREIVVLRAQLASQQTSPTAVGPSIKTSMSASASPTISNLPSHLDQYMGSEEGQEAVRELSLPMSPQTDLIESREEHSIR